MGYLATDYRTPLCSLLDSGLEAEEQRFFGQILHQREALEKQAILKSKMKVSSRPRKIEVLAPNECLLLRLERLPYLTCWCDDVQPRRPPRATTDIASVAESSVLSYD